MKGGEIYLEILGRIVGLREAAVAEICNALVFVHLLWTF